MDAIAPAESIHIGVDDLPFVEIGDGSKLKVLQVKLGSVPAMGNGEEQESSAF